MNIGFLTGSSAGYPDDDNVGFSSIAPDSNAGIAAADAGIRSSCRSAASIVGCTAATPVMAIGSIGAKL
jgi:hypothetical protein